jgi:hypothetical protein
VTLVTLFSMEEMAYLRGLPETVATNPIERQAFGLTSWTHSQDATGAAGCTAACDIWCHIRRVDDGSFVFYIRHGEAICCAGRCDERGNVVRPADYAEAYQWLQSLHAHEAAVR